jgi:hypothetical protein
MRFSCGGAEDPNTWNQWTKSRPLRGGGGYTYLRGTLFLLAIALNLWKDHRKSEDNCDSKQNAFILNKLLFEQVRNKAWKAICTWLCLAVTTISAKYVYEFCSLSIVTRLRAGQPGFDSRQRLRFIFLLTASRPALGPTQPTIHWVLEVLSPGLKRPGREADHSPLVLRLRIRGAVHPLRQYVFMALYLVKYRNNFTFTIPYNLPVLFWMQFAFLLRSAQAVT